MRKAISGVRSKVVALVALLALAAPAAASAASNPYDKFRNETYSNKGLMSEQQELQLGAQVHQQVLQQYRLVRDPEINEYVENLGERLARASRRPDIPYHFYVIDDPAVNAFSIPGGYVYVNVGLLKIAQGEDELAAAMAHEIGHVVARHGLRNIKKAQRTQLLFGILGIGAEIATGGAAGQAARAASELLAAGVITKNSREFEREADFLGLYNLTQVGYDPNGMVRIFQRLGSASTASKSQIGGIFASHPDSGERERNTQIEIQQHLAGTIAARGAGPNGNGTTRTRRAGSVQGQVAFAPPADLGFAGMKRALGSYRSGGGGYDQYGQQQGGRRGGQRRQQQGTYDPNADPNYPATYDPNDPNNQPAQNERPVLKRHP